MPSFSISVPTVRKPVEGDRIDIGGFMLTAKEVDGGGNIGSMGLKVPR